MENTATKKAYGICRHIDDLGRLVIPKEMRKRLGWNIGDLIDISMQDNTIMCTKVDTDAIIQDTLLHLSNMLEEAQRTPGNTQLLHDVQQWVKDYKG